MGAGKPSAAVEVFAEVVKVAVPAGIYQSILEQGPEIEALLQVVRTDSRHSVQMRDITEYIDRLLKGCRAAYQHDSKSQCDAARESLSARERNIVELIARGAVEQENRAEPRNCA